MSGGDLALSSKGNMYLRVKLYIQSFCDGVAILILKSGSLAQHQIRDLYLLLCCKGALCTFFPHPSFLKHSFLKLQP